VYPFEFRPRKQPKVIRRKLGREASWGSYCDGVIEIDDRLKGKQEFTILVHEYLHHIQPELSEEEVIRVSESLVPFLWKQGYRKVDNNDRMV